MLEPIEVLIVEDDLRIGEIHRRFTEKVEGFKVLASASTGAEALDWIDVAHPKLVLLDVYLPDMLGMELIKHIRQQDQDIDIIMITAASEVEMVRGALHGGVYDYIVKPLMLDRFRRSLENYRQHLEQLKHYTQLKQEQIDELLLNTSEKIVIKRESLFDMPKGIDHLTLDKVMGYVMKIQDLGITAEGLSKAVGISRSTARRYLEYLVARKEIYAELIYGSIGRPERRYFRASS